LYLESTTSVSQPPFEEEHCSTFDTLQWLHSTGSTTNPVPQASNPAPHASNIPTFIEDISVSSVEEDDIPKIQSSSLLTARKLDEILQKITTNFDQSLILSNRRKEEDDDEEKEVDLTVGISRINREQDSSDEARDDDNTIFLRSAGSETSVKVSYVFYNVVVPSSRLRGQRVRGEIDRRGTSV